MFKEKKEGRLVRFRLNATYATFLGDKDYCGIYGNQLFELDQEDLDYLYNKYSKKAVEEMQQDIKEMEKHIKEIGKN